MGAARRERRRHRAGAGPAGGRARGRPRSTPTFPARAARSASTTCRPPSRAARPTSWSRPASAAVPCRSPVVGDSLALQGFNPEVGGNGSIITEPPRSGKNTAPPYLLHQPAPDARDADRPRRSPLLVDPPHGGPVFTGSEPIEEIKRAPRQGPQRPRGRGQRLRGRRQRQPAGLAAHRPLRRDARLRQPDDRHPATSTTCSASRTAYPNEMKRGRSGPPSSFCPGLQRRRRPRRAPSPVGVRRPCPSPRRTRVAAGVDVGAGAADVGGPPPGRELWKPAGTRRRRASKG